MSFATRLHVEPSGNPEMRVGFPAALNTVLLARHLGRRKALEIAISGATFSAEHYACATQVIS